MMKYVKTFMEVSIEDVGLVGGKNASLGQMITELVEENIRIPDGFAITAQAYQYVLEHNNLHESMRKAMQDITASSNLVDLQKAGKAVRELIEHAILPEDLQKEIIAAYNDLSSKYDQKNCDVAVRSSATAEDLPTASFAGQQETFLNVTGERQLLESVIRCMASLFTDRAISYRMEKNFDHFEVALSVGVQKMIRSDKACSGVAFSLDTESGFKDVVMINGAYGLGESIVQGLVIPDEFLVHTTTLLKGYRPIIRKRLGDKKITMIYHEDPKKLVKTIASTEKQQQTFCLTDDEILELARMVSTIEAHYTQVRGTWTPMDVEWAKDGVDNKLYIIQARPETIHSSKKNQATLTQYTLSKDVTPQVIIKGQSIGQKMVTGVAKVITSIEQIHEIKTGDIIITGMTDPDWVPVMKKASGIITDRGGRTCHAAIVSRELGIAAIVGTQNATKSIKNGQTVTIDCSQGKTGFVYEGEIPFETKVIKLTTLPELPIKLLVNIADVDSAFNASFLPVSGVGLARLEFIITNTIKVHPMALLQPEKVLDKAIVKQIDNITVPYSDKATYFVDSLAQGIATIAAAFHPREVVVRVSDFKSNEYRNLIGGKYFEPEEENPMLGFRGASRYYHERYKDAFALECAALKKVRGKMGLDNITIMIPFVRTVQEGKSVLKEMEKHGLKKGENGLRIIMMCEIPSNVILIDEFSQVFDGFSIGSNDLTQTTLGVDRDSELLSDLFDERNQAVKRMFELAIIGAHRNEKPIGICGQAPSDYEELATFLVDTGIDSLSLNVDSVIPFMMKYQ